MYTHGYEVHSFRPCNSGQTWWVSGTRYVLGDLQEYVTASMEHPYQPVYLEFRGHPHVEAIDGFAADYDGVVHISEVQAWLRPGESLCDAASANPAPSPVVGVEKVLAGSQSNYEVHSARGRGAVQLYRAPWSRLTIIFVYDDEKEFGELEGVSITDVSSREGLSVDELVKGGELLILGTRLMIMPRDKPINWRINFVDYYR
jgi:hypothetical protein